MGADCAPSDWQLRIEGRGGDRVIVTATLAVDDGVCVCCIKGLRTAVAQPAGLEDLRWPYAAPPDCSVSCTATADIEGALTAVAELVAYLEAATTTHLRAAREDQAGETEVRDGCDVESAP